MTDCVHFVKKEKVDVSSLSIGGEEMDIRDRLCSESRRETSVTLLKGLC